MEDNSNIDDIVNFLSDTRSSDERFNRFKEFVYFKDKINHIQNFDDLYTEIYKYFHNFFLTDDIKITRYDTKKDIYETLYSVMENTNIKDSSVTIKYTYTHLDNLKGEIILQFTNEEQKEFANQEKEFLDYILYELKPIIANHLILKSLNDLSYTDYVTGLPNRRFLIKHINMMFNVVKQEDIEFAFLKVDIDHFKAVVEEFNHEVGNDILKMLANTIIENTGETDIVTAFEESSFMICMQDIKDEDKIQMLAQKIIDVFASRSIVVDKTTKQRLKKTVCIGISIHPKDSDNLDDLFKKGDIALEEAKNKGRGSYEFYKDEQNNIVEFF